MTVVKSAEVNCPLDTQLGSWLYQTQLCPRRSWPFVLARLAIWSPPEKVNVPRVGSVASYHNDDGSGPNSQLQRNPYKYPFHGVGRGDLPELGLVVEDGGIGCIGELAIVSSGTEVLLASGLGEGVESRARGSGGASGGGWRCGGRRWRRRRCGLAITKRWAR